MSGRRLAFAALAALAVLALAWWLEVERPRRRALELERAARLLEDSEGVLALEVRRSDQRYAMSPGSDGSWSLSASDLSRPQVADIRAVRLLLGALVAARLETLEDEADSVEDLRPFGLEPRRLSIAWTTARGERSVVLGSSVPPDGRRVYGLFEGRLVTAPRDLAFKSAWGSDHWRRKTLLQIPADRLRRLTIERNRELPPGATERIVLSLDDHPRGVAGAWRLVEPVDAPAHPPRTRALQGRLQPLLADGFGPEEPGPDELEAAGLSPPRVVLTVELVDETRHRLEIGRPRELRPEELEQAKDREVFPPVQARLDGGGIVHVAPDLVESLLLGDDLYRDNRALPARLDRLVGFTFVKPHASAPPSVVELARDLEGPWVAVRPAAVELPVAPVGAVFDALQEVLFGRFEDEMAADPMGFETAYDLSQPDTFSMEVRGIDLEGRPISLSIEAGPPGAIVLGRDPFRPVKLTDQAGRRSVGVAKFRAFDDFLERLFVLRDSIEAGSDAAALPVVDPAGSQGTERDRQGDEAP